MAIIDCSQTIEPHWRWSSTAFVSQAYAEGDEFQEFGLKWHGTGFSFTSAPGWRIEGAKTLDDFPVDRFCGLSSVVSIAGRSRITRHDLAAIIGSTRLSPIVLLHSGHADLVPIRRRSYWTAAPVIEADCADLLAERGCLHVVVDISLEDIPALRADERFSFFNQSKAFSARAHQHGMIVTENATGLSAFPEERVFFAALPLRGQGLTTSPCRPIALTEWGSDTPIVRDVSTPLENHWRWYLELWPDKSFANGDGADETHFVFTGHGFTHCDAPRHMERYGPSMQELPNGGLDIFCGPASVVDLSELAPATAISPEILAERGLHVKAGEIIVLRSDLTNRLGYSSRRWHLQAPYLTESGARWIADLKVAAVALDFPQDRVAREMPDRHVTNAEFVAHHAILGAGIPFIEDLRDLGAIGSERTFLLAVPLKTACPDGAPMRVVSITW